MCTWCRARCSGRERRSSDALFPPKGPLEDRLFRNDLTVGADGSRTLHFTDVTEQSGIDVETYGMGVAAGDYRQRRLRRHLSHRSRPNSVLLRNNCDGTFTDVTARAGVGNPGGWSVSAAFVDYDRDGWLDLFVGNYLIYSLDGRRRMPQPCRVSATTVRRTATARSRASCFTTAATGRSPTSRGSALVGGAYGPALGVSTADFNGDGWIDIYVANDGQPNQLWINQNNGTFKNTALLAGAAVERRRATPKPAWASTPAISTTTATRICSSPTGSTR